MDYVDRKETLWNFKFMEQLEENHPLIGLLLNPELWTL